MYGQLEVPKSNRYQDNPDKIKYLKLPELQALMQVVKKESIRDYAIFMLSYYHGLRISEVGKLFYAPQDSELSSESDYSEETRRITLHRAKGGLGFTYLVCEEVYSAIKKWFVIRGREPGALFPSRKTKLSGSRNLVSEFGEPKVGAKTNKVAGISKRQLDTLFKYYAEKAKIAKDRWHFHTLRHSIAVAMIEKDIPLVQIADWLGHRSIMSTTIYAKVSDKARNETAERLYGEGRGKVRKGAGIDWKKDKRK